MVGVLVAGWLASAPGGLAASDAGKTREWVAVVSSGSASVAEKARACQQLAIHGTPEAVPALASLLGQDPLAHYAREALEAMAEPTADAALREALGRVQGGHLVGVVNSLGMRRDAAAVPALRKLARDANLAVATAAWLALARIGTPEATQDVREVLTSGTGAAKTAVAEAALLIADGLLGRGATREAAGWFNAVRSAGGSEQVRLSALRGVILASDDGVTRLLETLKSSDAAERAVAVRAIRDLASAEVTPALASGMEQLTPEVQALAIAALVDRGDERARPLFERQAAAKEEVVRLAALKALGKAGASSSLPLLLQAATGRAKAEADAAQRSLAQIAGPAVDDAILQAATTASPAARVALIGILGERGATPATAAMLRWARDPDAAVSRAALRALTLLARPADLPALIALSVALKEDDVRILADRAIHAASMKILEPAQRAEPVMAAFREAKDGATRAALLRPLGAVVRAMGGSEAARMLVEAAVRDPDEAVREAAVKALADWPDASPLPTLLGVVRANPAASQRAMAFDGLARMAGDVATGRDKNALDALAVFKELNTLAASDAERMKVVAGLGNLRRAEAFRMLVPYLDQPAVATEAALAVVQIAPGLLNSKDAAEVRTTLQRIVEREKDGDVRAKAARVLEGVGPAAKKGKAKKG